MARRNHQEQSPDKGVLGLGSDLELMAVIALGWPDEKPRTTKRKMLKELIVYRD